jgi:proline iminopeptidase
MIFRDVDRANIESFFRSIGDLHRTDLQTQVSRLRIPTLGVFGVRDNIVNPNQSELLTRNVPQAQVVMMRGSRHFPMLDEPERFKQVVQDFLSDVDRPGMRDGRETQRG